MVCYTPDIKGGENIVTKSLEIHLNLRKHLLDINGVLLKLAPTLRGALTQEIKKQDNLLVLSYRRDFTEDDSPAKEDKHKIEAVYKRKHLKGVKVSSCCLEENHYLSLEGDFKAKIYGREELVIRG